MRVVAAEIFAKLEASYGAGTVIRQQRRYQKLHADPGHSEKASRQRPPRKFGQKHSAPPLRIADN